MNVRQSLRRAVILLACVAGVGGLGVLLLIAFTPVPEELSKASLTSSLRVYDRNERLVRELRTRDGRKTGWVSLEEVAPDVVACLLSAEDSRFRLHPGIDPLAITRAAYRAAVARRIVSGASTLTQQLARRLVPRPRTLWGKLREAAVALRIEASFDKDRILTEYLNRIEFGPNLVGIDAASRHYFDKPARVLDLAESAALIALVRGPGYYDPRKGTVRLERRRNWVLTRVRERQAAPEARISRAEREPIRIRSAEASSGGEHFAFALSASRPVKAHGSAPFALYSTLDLELQRDVEAIAQRSAAELRQVLATALSALVVDNRTGDVLAYVGSPDYFAVAALGANDGVRALRQPGSTLKPFIYAAAMERLGWNAATLLPDLGLELSTPSGPYVPRNYNGREHGPVRLRVALANSLNLPAVRTVVRIGPAAALSMLKRFGFASLSRDAEHYGAAIALGDGEVRLTELAAAYSALARDGEWRPLRYLRRAEFPDRQSEVFGLEPPRRVLPSSIARQITSMLADERARRPSFGADSVLSFAFPAAAKTGTSKGFRDNWAIGYTREVTVAVWVGNFDGRPMVQSSGVSGAGPVFQAVMERAMRGRRPEPLTSDEGFIEQEICPLSGALPSSACPHRVRESFLPAAVPNVSCEMHELVSLTITNGQRAFEKYDAPYAEWARNAGRPLAPPAARRARNVLTYPK